MSHVLIPIVFGVDLAVVCLHFFGFFCILFISTGQHRGSVNVTDLAFAADLNLALVVDCSQHPLILGLLGFWNILN